MRRGRQPHRADHRRNRRRARWFHAGVYLTVLGLLATGWWLALGQEGRPSVLARITGMPDIDAHTWLGWGFTAVAVLGPLLHPRGAVRLVRESVRFDRSDAGWLVRWPKAAFIGRFAYHDGRFDPCQRIANLVMIILPAALLVSVIGLWAVSGGPMFVWFNRIHRWSTYLVTPVIIGHILIASGLLPGYRGVWRSMHLGGRLRRRDAAQVWPGWVRRNTDTDDDSRPPR